MGLSHISLQEYYNILFSLAQHHKYSIAEIEGLLPYERDLFVDMLIKLLEEQKKELEQKRK